MKYYFGTCTWFRPDSGVHRTLGPFWLAELIRSQFAPSYARALNLAFFVVLKPLLCGSYDDAKIILIFNPSSYSTGVRCRCIAEKFDSSRKLGSLFLFFDAVFCLYPTPSIQSRTWRLPRYASPTPQIFQNIIGSELASSSIVSECHSLVMWSCIKLDQWRLVS